MVEDRYKYFDDEPTDFEQFMIDVGKETIVIFQKAVEDALNCRKLNVQELKTFVQYDRIVKMLNRLSFISKYYDSSKLNPNDYSFYDIMRDYASGDDCGNPDMDRGLELPQTLRYWLKHHGLTIMGNYLMEEARYIRDSRNPEPKLSEKIYNTNDDYDYESDDYESDNIKRKYTSRPKGFDRKLFLGPSAGSFMGCPASWNAFDIINGITHSNLD